MQARKSALFFFSPQPSVISEDEKNLREIISTLKKWDNTKGSWFYQYTIPVTGLITWGIIEIYWISTEISARMNPAWIRRNEVAWNKGHTDYVNFTHYDCDDGGHSAVKHYPDLQYDFSCMAGPISTCCELVNGPNWITAIGTCGFFVGMAANGLLAKWGSHKAESQNQPVNISERDHSKIIQLIQEDILNQYERLPLEQQPTAFENIQCLKQDLQTFKTNPVDPKVITNIMTRIQTILADMQKTQLPLNGDLSAEDSDEQARLLSKGG